MIAMINAEWIDCLNNRYVSRGIEDNAGQSFTCLELAEDDEMESVPA